MCTFCSKCDSELEITEEDIHIGYLGAAYITCPCCGMESMVDDSYGITLNMNNVEFPTHFTRVNKDKNGVAQISDNSITAYIKEAIGRFRNDKTNYCMYTCYGDLFAVIFREEDEYYVVVTKDFYETNIPFEKLDY